MDNESAGFTEKVLDMTNKFYTTAMKMIGFQKKLQGITVDVERTSEESKYSKVFGGVYNSDNIADDEVNHFHYKILIQVNEMKRLYTKAIGQLDFYDNESVLRKGDTITYTRNNQKFKFKVSEVDNFSDTEGILYRYTLVGLIETKIL